MNEIETCRIFARKSGNNTVVYRWLGEIGSGRLVKAQDFPGISSVDYDTWGDDVDARVTRRTLIAAPAGHLVLSSEYDRNKHVGYVAGITSAADPKAPIDWSRARWVSMRTVDADPSNKRARQVIVHTIEVDGERGEYRCE